MLEVARSVDLTPDLIPVIGPLFAGLSSLGSTPRRLASLVAQSSVARFSEPGLSSSSPRILDLACGKGAASVEIARRTRGTVLGVDACEEFLDAARALAARHSVQSRCRWVHADVRAFARTHRARYDAALMIGLFPLAKAAPLLRSFVRPGGVYLIDDAVLDPTDPGAADFEGVPDAVACVAMIERLGDRVERRVLLPRTVIESQNRTIHARLASAAASLAKTHPGLRTSLRAFVSRQKEASAVLLGPLRPTIWVVRRVQSRRENR